jgi:hypothetical protein
MKQLSAIDDQLPATSYPLHFKALNQLPHFQQIGPNRRFKALKSYLIRRNLQFKGLKQKTHLPERKALSRKVTTQGEGGRPTSHQLPATT